MMPSFDIRSDGQDEVGTPQRAFVGGTCWWNRAIVRTLFSTAAGAPRFFDTCDEAVNEAAAGGGFAVAWTSRLEPQLEAKCSEKGVDLIRIEDGFVRSVGLGAGWVSALSLAVDRRGIHYDARRPSDLEHLLKTATLSDDACRQGAAIREQLVALRLSKYNLPASRETKPIHCARPIVLVPGQVADDASIRTLVCDHLDPVHGGNINLQLLRAVRQRHPKAFIVFKPHPDVTSGLRSGAVDRGEMLRLADLVADDQDVISVIEACDHVETISSLTGFEALLRGRTVTVHGLPFYAGWGLTEDLTPARRRGRRRTLDELVFLAMNVYTRHVDPVTGRQISALELLDRLAKHRRQARRRVQNAAMKQLAWAVECVENWRSHHRVS